MKEQINSDSKSKNQRITKKFKKWEQRKKGTVEGVRQFREESGEIVRRINQKVEKEKEKKKNQENSDENGNGERRKLLRLESI